MASGEYERTPAMIENNRRAKFKHGKSNSPEYQTWHYRKFDMCEYWQKDFMNFYKDVGKKPEGACLTLIDESKPFSKSNCRWSIGRRYRKKTIDIKRPTIHQLLEKQEPKVERKEPSKMLWERTEVKKHVKFNKDDSDPVNVRLRDRVGKLNKLIKKEGKTLKDRHRLQEMLLEV